MTSSKEIRFNLRRFWLNLSVWLCLRFCVSESMGKQLPEKSMVFHKSIQKDFSPFNTYKLNKIKKQKSNFFLRNNNHCSDDYIYSVRGGQVEHEESTSLEEASFESEDNSNYDAEVFNENQFVREDDNNEDQPKEIISSVIPHISKNTPFSILMNYNSENHKNLKEQIKFVIERLSPFLSNIINHEALSGPVVDSIILLLTTAIVIPTMKCLGSSNILGFLCTGMLLGPHGFSLVKDIKTTEALAELGIVFFLFEMGLELSVERLIQMRKDVFGLGLSQFALTTVAFYAISHYVFRLPSPASVIIGAALALSSSAFVLQLLKDDGAMSTRYGKASFGILLLQDLAVVPLLVIIPLLAPSKLSTQAGNKELITTLFITALKAIGAVAAITQVGSYALDKIFNFVALSKSHEAFLAVILVTVLGMSRFTEALGLSNTLGAFMAGIVLSETKYRYQVESDIAPFRGLLLGLFFMTVGFEIDLHLIFSYKYLPLIVLLVGIVLSVKTLIITLLGGLFDLSFPISQRVGLLCSQGGEFAFVACGMAKHMDILPASTVKLILTTVALSMAATPLLYNLGETMSSILEERKGISHISGDTAEAKMVTNDMLKDKDFVLVVGYGRMGKLVCELFDKKLIPYMAFDSNPNKVKNARDKGLPVFYGDISRTEVLKKFHISQAKQVIVTHRSKLNINRSVHAIRKAYPDLPIITRAADSTQANILNNIKDVKALIPVDRKESFLLSLPFGGKVLEELNYSEEEISILLNEIKARALNEDFLVNEEE